VKKVGSYLKSNDKCLKEGDALLEKGDYVQASEKFGGAAAEGPNRTPTALTIGFTNSDKSLRYPQLNIRQDCAFTFI